MQYTVGPLVFVRLRHKDNEPPVVYCGDDGGLIKAFRAFCEKEGLICVGNGSSGPGILTGYYTYIEPTNEPVERLSERIQTWLDEIGATAKQEW